MTAGSAITVVGAGPVGALMSLYLARRGFEVTVYERRPDMRRKEISAGRSINLALANRGIDALERVGLMDEVQRHLIPMRGRMIHHEGGDLDLLPYGNKPEEVIYSVSRAELNKTLMNAAEAEGATIRFGWRCESINLRAGTLTLVDEGDGGRRDVPCGVVIGADGGGSAVREAVVTATNGAQDEDILGHGYKELTIPPGTNGGFRMEENALHIWPRGGFMLIALPNPNGSFTATLFLSHEGKESFAALQTDTEVEAFFNRHFPDAAPLIADLTSSFFANPTGMLGTVRCFPWHHEGKAVVMGDAAHAIVPFHGQGMNAGFEDYVALDGCIARFGTDWNAVFAVFEEGRKPDADAIADMALENYIEMRDTVRDPKFLLKKELSWKLEERYPDRFIPRYSMVMFHLLPYAEAYRRGKLQAAILDELTESAGSLDEVDFDRAAILIEKMM
ncbi:MAG: NAD(P)-binding protein [Alphaproteobacteria bacterium]|nr:NAD(P)-binding protein [Alphaproteobacteria bacterium]